MTVGAQSETRYAVVPGDSWLTFATRSTLHGVHGKAANLEGYLEASWTADGNFSEQPAPRMHVEFPVEQLRSGNTIQDREMWKVVDSKRFPRVVADLRDIHPMPTPGRYAASGAITLAGRVRTYEGELVAGRSGDRVTIEGDLSLDIRDYGLKPPNLLFIKVEPVVLLSLHLVAMRAT